MKTGVDLAYILISQLQSEPSLDFQIWGDCITIRSDNNSVYFYVHFSELQNFGGVREIRPPKPPPL